MGFVTKEWLDRSDPLFDSLTSPELDADNLNRFEAGILTNDESFNNLSTGYCILENITPQSIGLASATLVFDIYTNSTNTDIFTINEANNTFTIIRPGTFNFKTNTTYSTSTGIATTITTRIVDAFLSTVWQEDSFIVNTVVGEGITNIVNKPLKFIEADLPKTLKFICSADRVGVTLSGINYTLNTFTTGSDGGDHSQLSGTNDNDCHPISAITSLSGHISGNELSGEAT